MPAQDHLRSRYPVRRSNLGEHGFGEVAAPERAVALDHNTACARLGQPGFVVLPRRPWDLIHRWRDPGCLDQLVNLVCAVVADTDGGCEPGLASFEEPLPKRYRLVAARGAMDQPQIDVVGAELAQAVGDDLAF